MKVKDIVKLCGKLLDFDFDQTVFESDDSGLIEQAFVGDKRLRLLTECVIFCEKELACDYIPLNFSQTFPTNIAPYNDFSKTVHEVVKVTDQYGDEVSFKYTPDSLIADTKGKINVTYHYRPISKTFCDDLETGNCKLDERVFAYGAIAEYMFLTNNSDEAAMWDKRYKDLIEVVIFSNRSLKIKNRRWL
jgi:hypothetical protein